VAVRNTREQTLRYDLTRHSRSLGFAALIFVLGNSGLQTAVAEGDTRTLSFHHAHTGEDITVTFKRNGRYDQAALAQLNWFMRDWRKEAQVEMNPELFDILWETYREVGGQQPIQVICGYRSPDTNAMLRARSNGVAENSQHTQGNAMDFSIPGVPLDKIREAGLRLQSGGVGFYPTSGSPFVHLDTGNIRHWPRMTHDQLAHVFPDGRTVHIPTDGQPLARYDVALADVEARGKSPSSLSLVAARNSGVIDETEERGARDAAPAPNLIANLLGLTKDEPKDAKKLPAMTLAAVTVAGMAPVAPAIVPMPKQRPAAQIALALRVPMPAARPEMPVFVASAEPAVTTSATIGLAYAAETPVQTPIKVVSATGKPMGDKMPRLASGPGAAKVVAAPTAMVDATPVVLGDDPWLRATILAPSVSTHLSTNAVGRYDAREIATLLTKPSSMVAMNFATDPMAGLSASRFSGSAVVFVTTATFRTAALR
jgi:uncharacterized protein YcbK (DUF882 family)